ncbi:MAG: AAA family ATPase, partial [Anaerolineae bacterium]|nr:AAA family ATPase [Anaerolineae bacterium]
WAGQSATALLQYQSCARLLETELGLSPAAETTALAEAIKHNHLPPPVTLATNKEPKPITLSPPPPAVPEPPPHNLPLQATPFVGREAALDSLQQRLADPEVRLITIVGPGGIGKTRLALALAERQLRPQPGVNPTSPVFADGIYFVSLAPIKSVETLVQAIAQELAFPLASAQEPTVQLLAYLRHKQMLLVLDNFDYILAGAALISQILQTAVGVKVLVTSRERLNLAQENLWPISGLNFARLTSVEKALAYDAVRLFVQRARQVQPDFTLPAEGLPYLERILQGVWGMPLAIELAAAWLNMLSLAEIAAELSQGLDLLEGEVRDVPNRHRSMRLVFDRSWERLEPEERALFKALSVFRGNFSRDAAQQVTGASLRLLAGLVNKSLLASQPDSGRYELHDLIRQYAAEHLQAEPATERTIRDRHSDYYLTLLQTREPALRSHRQKEALAELNADLDNIRTAWETAVAHEEIDRLHRAAFPLWYFYNLRDSLREGEGAFGQAAVMVRGRLSALALDHPKPDQARLECALGEFLSHQAQYTFRQGRNVEAAALYQTSLALLRPLDDPAALGQALTYCGVVCWIAGQFEQAWPYLNEGLARFSQLGDKWLQAQTRTFMGMVAHAEGDYPGAYAYLSESMADARALGDPRLMSLVAGQLGQTAQALGRMAEVLDLLRETLRLTTETGDRLGIGVTLEQMAIAMQANGDVTEGRWLLQESIDQFRDVGDSWFLSHALNLAGYFALAAADEAQALDSFKEAGHIAVAAQATPNILDALAGLAMLAARQDQPERALELASHILQHPASSQEAKDRAERLRVELGMQLTPPQPEAIHASGQPQSLERIFKAALDSIG